VHDVGPLGDVDVGPSFSPLEARNGQRFFVARYAARMTVLMKCGTPFFAQTFCLPLRYVDLDFVRPSDAAAAVSLGCFPVDEWSYNPGSGQFVAIMHFEAGRLASIRYGDRIP